MAGFRIQLLGNFHSPRAMYWLGLAIGLTSCQLVFGDYHLVDGTGGTAGSLQGGSGTTGGDTFVAGGTATGGASSFGGSQPTGGSPSDCTGTPPFRCQGAALQACVNGAWTTTQTCPTAALCEPAAGVCDACATGDRQCSGSVLSVCNADHTGFMQKAVCEAPLYCDTTSDNCVACTINQSRCDGDSVDVCNEARTAWTLKATACSDYGCYVVDGSTDHCSVCDASSPAACSGDVLRTCSAGLWTATTCTNGCVDATATTPAACY